MKLIKEDLRTNTEIEMISDQFFISKYSAMFNEYLSRLDDNTKYIIRNNKQLNDLYDLFLDYIIDSNQHLDYKEAKKYEQEA